MKKEPVNKMLLRAYRSYENYLRRGRWDIIHYILGNQLYFRLKSYLEIRPVAHLYPPKRVKKQLKTVVLMFDGQVYNAGLADRLRSMTSVYYWCKENNVHFKIYFVNPFALSEYLIPNKYAWVLTADELSYENSCPKALVSYNGVFGMEKNAMLHRQYLNSFLQTGYEQIHLYTNTYCYDDYFNGCFHVLFKPTNLLSKELENFQKQVGVKYISISFRFAQLLGDLKDTFGFPLLDEEKESLIEKCINNIKPIIDANGVEKALVTSDSVTFLEKVRKLPYVYILPGLVGHISNNVSDEQVRKTFWDMFMISRAQKAYMVRTQQMYHSGFAQRAAMIGNVAFEEIVLS